MVHTVASTFHSRCCRILNFSIFPALLLRFKEFEQVGLLVAEIMDIDGVDDDLHILDPELLQLPGLSPSPLKPTSLIADDLFSQWLSLPETATLVKSLIDDAKSGTPTNKSKNLPSVFLSSSTPPLSPRSSSGSPRFSRQRTSPPSLHSPLRSLKEPKRQLIPQIAFVSRCRVQFKPRLLICSSTTNTGVHQQKN